LAACRTAISTVSRAIDALSNPIRELIAEHGGANLEALFTKRQYAEELAPLLNCGA
jgi:hypothetical protein